MANDESSIDVQGALRGRQRSESRRGKPFTPEELEEFFRACDAIEEPGLDREPDWEEHLRNIDESRRRHLPPV